MHARYYNSNAELYEELGWHTLAIQRTEKSKLVIMLRLVYNLAPDSYALFSLQVLIPIHVGMR